jgi:hypothetical protein
MAVYILEFSHIVNTSKQPVPQAPYNYLKVAGDLTNEQRFRQRSDSLGFGGLGTQLIPVACECRNVCSLAL